jgi:protoporphyrinogen/coproporphyrinogen III oxidase
MSVSQSRRNILGYVCGSNGNKMRTPPGSGRTAVIVGAGISGLSCAYYLSQACPDLQIRILESSARAGGVIKSINQDDLLVECGPESFSTLKADVLDLSGRLNISEHIIQTNQANRRAFVCLDHKLHALPEGLLMFAPSNLWSFVLTDVFSLPGKLRMSLDLVLPRYQGDRDESLSQFVTRRLGDEALRTLAEPMVSGICGGDPEMLSAASTIPQIVEMERKYGSVIKGLFQARMKRQASMQAAGPRYGALSSFDNGISVLVENIIKQLPQGCLFSSKTATHIIRGRNQASWTVLCADNSAFDADCVVLATPAQKAAMLLTEINPSLALRLQKIPRSPAIIINLVYDRNRIRHALDGFGFVVPRKEGMLISACSFSSVKFDGRAAKDRVLLRLFTGGMLKTQAMEMTDDEILQKCHQELKEIIGVEQPPLAHFLVRHAEAIPQYLVGHSELLAKIRDDLGNSPGIELAGNSYSGVGLSDCIKTARLAAANICGHLDNLNGLSRGMVSFCESASQPPPDDRLLTP